MKVTIHFVNGQKLTVDRTLDEVSRVLGGFEQAEATIPMQGGMTLFFNPAHVTHVSRPGEVNLNSESGGRHRRPKSLRLRIKCAT